MDAVTLRGLIEQSLLLTPLEKTYWLEHYQKLPADQQEKLAGILAPEQDAAFDRDLQNALSFLAPGLINALKSA